MSKIKENINYCDMERMKKEFYVAPILEVVRFQMEKGYAESAFVTISDFDEGLFP